MQRDGSPLAESRGLAFQMSRRSTMQSLPSDLVLEDGRRIEIRGPLGAGSASSVFRAVVDSPYGLRRLVAAKVFGVLASDDAESVVAALLTAAQRSAFVHHPNVVQTYDFLMFQDQPVMLLELVQGVTLATFVERVQEHRRRLPLDLALFIALEVAEGLSGARAARDDDDVQLGLLHLALTQREIFLSWRGEVKVDGFGLEVTRAGTSSVRTLSGLAGRASMMAPEVASGFSSDARADVFSLGILLRELLVGPRFPNGISNAESVRLAREGYLHPVLMTPDLPDELALVISRAIAIDPEDRYPNATAMVVDMRKIALAMGVGDLRYFLRRALDDALREGLEDETREVLLADARDEARDEARDDRD
jgi:serine/threonine-protein kinase